jgi:hypothetical protein
MVEGAGQRRVTVVDPREAILGIESSFWREQVREKRFPRSALAVDFPAVADAENQHQQAVVFNLHNEPVITHAVFPELT